MKSFKLKALLLITNAQNLILFSHLSNWVLSDNDVIAITTSSAAWQTKRDELSS
jgi:hypothetical protein